MNHARVTGTRPRWRVCALTTCALATCALALAGCGSPEGPAAADARLVIDGRLERGATIAVAAWRGADSIPGSQLQLVVQPAEAATGLDGGKLRLGRAGPFTIVATLPGGEVVSAPQVVSAPPSVLVDFVVDGNRDIYRVALDGGDLLRLTSDPSDDSHATSGGGTVVFTTYRHGQGELYALPLAAGLERRLTTTTASETDPALSADGLRLAFLRPVLGVTRVWVGGADAVGAQRLTLNDAAGAGSPEASPSWGAGSVLAFTTTVRGGADIATNSTDVLPVLPAVSSFSSSSADVEPSWSADGTRLAFVSTRDAAAALFVTSSQASVALRLNVAREGVAQPVWMPDGRIVFVSRGSTGMVLSWLDPAFPSEIHDIPLPGQHPAHPAPVR